MLELLGDYVDRLLAFRSRAVSRPWIDIRFRDFVTDPLRGIERIYEAAGLPLAEPARASMAQWVREHPRSDLRRARPADLAPYGIDPDWARERFAAYCSAFDVEIDGV